MRVAILLMLLAGCASNPKSPALTYFEESNEALHDRIDCRLALTQRAIESDMQIDQDTLYRVCERLFPSPATPIVCPEAPND